MSSSPKRQPSCNLPRGLFPYCRPSQKRGVALVMVLAFLVLLAGLLVAFYTSVTTNTKASFLYAKNVQTEQLAQSAISIAMSQIKDATTQPSGTTWISQPGLIRTFNSSGSPVN